MRQEVMERDGFKVVENGKTPLETTTTHLTLLASQHRDFLLSPSGTQIKIRELQGKVVGIYFSANWYPPCLTFTKLLIDVYEQLKTSTGSNFEVVFVSSDEDLDAFNNYYSCMPWLAIPFSDLESKKSLNSKFDVEGMPCLIILQPNDSSTLRDGVEMIYRYGVRAFPFTKERVDELLDEEREKHERQTLISLLTSHGRDFLLANHLPNQVQVASLMGKTIGLLFSAQWCLPCVNFIPKLISTYEKIKQVVREDAFEIVLVSSDHNKVDFDLHFSPMPWLALPFGDPTIKNLAKYFDIRDIPSLVILGPDGKTVTKHGRSLVNLYEDSGYPFTKTRVEELEKLLDEEAKNLPKTEFHSRHRHELTLVSQGNGGGLFICCDCDEQGFGWAYQCMDCGYEIHPKCVRAVMNT